MKNQERQRFAKIIAEQVAKLEAHVETLKQGTKPIAPDNAIGRLSRMEAIGDKSIKEANLRQAQERLVKLRLALKRVDVDSYGYCVQCEEPLPIKRLEIFPESITCINCLEEAS